MWSGVWRPVRIAWAARAAQRATVASLERLVVDGDRDRSANLILPPVALSNGASDVEINASFL